MEASMLATRGHLIPASQRPGIGRLPSLHGEQYAMWSPALEALARGVLEGTDWSRVATLAANGLWGAFEQAGLMVSGRDSLTPTHYDAHHNIFLQLAGAKRFLLLPATCACCHPCHPCRPCRFYLWSRPVCLSACARVRAQVRSRPVPLPSSAPARSALPCRP